MTDESNRPVALTLRLYRALARAFPQEFKTAYGEELLQATEDAIEPVWQRHGVPGLLRLLVDIALRVPAEHLSEFRQDVRYGVRMLARSPGFTAAAVVSLSLGICIVTSAYSEMSGLALRRLPGVPNPDELVAVQKPTSYPKYERYRQLSDVFSSTMAFVAPVPFGVSLGGHSERTWGHLVTPSYFATLGIRPALGRFFDDAPDGVVVSYRFWQSRLGASREAIGSTLRINGHPCTIAGIGPKDFAGASPMFFPADLWMPLSVGRRVAPELAGGVLDRRDITMFQVFGRLRRGVTPSSVEAELDAVSRQFDASFGELNNAEKGRSVLLLEGGKLLPVRKQDMPFVTVFFTVLSGLLLLIACSNVANMMLARAVERRREIAVRLALGASRARLIRQLLTESMLLAAGGGVLGALMSVWLMRAASRTSWPVAMPVQFDLSPDLRALFLAMGVTAFTGLVFGLAPALHATRTDLAPALKEGGNVRLRRFRRLSLRNVLVVQQVAGSLALLLLTAFLVLGVQKSTGIEVGFNSRNLYLVSVDPVREGYSADQARAFSQKLLDRVQALPGVTSASLTDTVPAVLNGNGWVPLSTGGAVRGAVKYVVGKDYFETLGIPIRLGRGFRREDEADNARVVIANEKLVRELWNGESPVGRHLETGTYEADPYAGLFYLGPFDYRLGLMGKRGQALEVIGVARDTRMEIMGGSVPPMIYFPLRAADYARPSMQGITLLVRAAPGVDVLRAVRDEISAMDPNLTPFEARGMPEQVERFAFMFRVAFWTYGLIGGFGLILACAGLAGVTAFCVAQRGREIGIRVALGARKADVLGLVMKEGAVLVVIGSALGLTGAWAGTRGLSASQPALAKSMLASTSDPLVLVGVPLLLAGLTLMACYAPARKSTRIDPVVALRQE